MQLSTATKLNPCDMQIFFHSLNSCAKAITALVNNASRCRGENHFNLFNNFNHLNYREFLVFCDRI
jgi:hypothetical protein